MVLISYVMVLLILISLTNNILEIKENQHITENGKLLLLMINYLIIILYY